MDEQFSLRQSELNRDRFLNADLKEKVSWSIV